MSSTHFWTTFSCGPMVFSVFGVAAGHPLRTTGDLKRQPDAAAQGNHRIDEPSNRVCRGWTRARPLRARRRARRRHEELRVRRCEAALCLANVHGRQRGGHRTTEVTTDCAVEQQLLHSAAAAKSSSDWSPTASASVTGSEGRRWWTRAKMMCAASSASLASVRTGVYPARLRLYILYSRIRAARSASPVSAAP